MQICKLGEYFSQSSVIVPPCRCMIVCEKKYTYTLYALCTTRQMYNIVLYTVCLYQLMPCVNSTVQYGNVLYRLLLDYPPR